MCILNFENSSTLVADIQRQDLYLKHNDETNTYIRNK